MGGGGLYGLMLTMEDSTLGLQWKSATWNWDKRTITGIRWPKVILSDLHDVLYLAKKLCIDRKAAIEVVADRGAKAECELTLVHEQCKST